MIAVTIFMVVLFALMGAAAALAGTPMLGGPSRAARDGRLLAVEAEEWLGRQPQP